MGFIQNQRLFHRLQHLTEKLHLLRDRIHQDGMTTPIEEEIQDFLDVPTIEDRMNEAIDEATSSLKLAKILAEKNGQAVLLGLLNEIQGDEDGENNE